MEKTGGERELEESSDDAGDSGGDSGGEREHSLELEL